MANYDVLIIGGGVIGLSLARELHRLKAGRIAIVERGELGREASYAAGGMLAPNAENEAVDDFYRVCDRSRSMFPTLAEELLAETGVDIELDRSGTLYTAFTEADSEHLGLRFERQVAAGIPVEKLDAPQALEAEPGLSPKVRESLYLRNDWQVENRRLLAALAEYAKRNGIEIVENSSVGSLITEGPDARGALVNGGVLSAGVTVLATGAWTSVIKIGDAVMPLKVRPIRGQMVSFMPANRMFKRVIYSPRGYLVPRADGRILAGATVEDVGFDKRTTDLAIEQLRATAIEIGPGLAAENISEKWSGLRPFAGQGHPIIGAIPGHDNLFVATAHYRNGILLAPVTAKLLAERIVNGRSSAQLDLFAPGRPTELELNANA